MEGSHDNPKKGSTVIVYYFVSGVVSNILIWATYQIFLHPLSKYPGPFVAKLSDIYGGFYAYKRRLFLETSNNHHKYGPVVRQGPNKLVFNSLEALKDIYRDDRTTKPEAYMALGPGLTRWNIFTAVEKNFHRGRRLLIGQVISERSMRVFEPTITSQIDIFIQNILRESRKSSPVNMTTYTRRLGLNIAGLLAFGYDLRLQTDERNQFMQTVLDGGVWASSLFLQYPPARKTKLGMMLMWSIRNLRESYLALMETMIMDRTAKPKNAEHDLYSFVADAMGNEDGALREGDLWAEANLFLTAAGDTVKTALSASFFYLSRNQTSYQKLAAEIRNAFSDSSEITGAGIAGLPYLRACIDEALRLSPPTPGVLWRDILPADQDKNQPFIVDGHVIPAGTIIGVNTYSIHHNEDYFPDPFTFRPDRWLHSSSSTFSAEQRKVMRDAFGAFSMGSRGCAGKAMAYLETSLVLAKTLWYFDFEKAQGQLGEIGEGKVGWEEGRARKEEFQLFDVFVAIHDGPYLSFQPRDTLWKKL